MNQLFPKKSIYHSQLVQAGTIDVIITGEPQKSKFQKNGQDSYWVGLKIEGNEHQLTLENATVMQKLTGYRNHAVQLTATGSRDEADIEVYDAAGPMKTPPQQPQGRQQAPSRQQSAPPAGNGIVNAKKHFIQGANAYVFAYGAALYAAREIQDRNGFILTDEMVQKMAASLFIYFDRIGGAIQQIPAHPLPDDAKKQAEPPRNQAPPQRQPEPEPPPRRPDPEPEPDGMAGADDEDIPF